MDIKIKCEAKEEPMRVAAGYPELDNPQMVYRGHVVIGDIPVTQGRRTFKKPEEAEKDALHILANMMEHLAIQPL